MEEEDFDEESDDGSGSEDIDVRNDDGVDVQNTSKKYYRTPCWFSPHIRFASRWPTNQFVEWLRHGQTINF